MGLLQFTASLPGGSRQCNSCTALPHSLGAICSGTRAMYCLNAWGQWAAELVQCTATLLEGSRQWNSFNALPPHCAGNGQCNSCSALPHFLGAVGSATRAMQCHTAWGRWAVEILQCAGQPAGGGGGKKIRANFFFVPPPFRGYPPKKRLAPHVGIFFVGSIFLLCAT